MKKIKVLIFILAFSFSHIANAIVDDDQLGEALLTGSATVQVQLETEVFNLINQSRVASFLPPLTWSSIVTAEARNHSLNMANKIVPFGHQGADIRFANLRKAIQNLTRFGENVAYNRGYTNPAEKAVSGWLRSPGHYANIMGDFNLTGVGVAKNLQGEYYFTQIFVKASSSVQSFENEAGETSEKSFSIPLEFVSEEPYLIELAE